MTCVVGLVDKKQVWMGADSAGVGDDMGLEIRADPKVFTIGRRFLIAFCGSFRAGQILRFHLRPPKHRDGKSVEEYMATGFCDAVKDCLRTGGYLKEGASYLRDGSGFLVAYKGRLFHIQSDFQCAESVHGYAAIGNGAPFALGAMYVTDGEDPQVRIMRALAAAQTFSAAVREPFLITSFK